MAYRRTADEKIACGTVAYPIFAIHFAILGCKLETYAHRISAQSFRLVYPIFSLCQSKRRSFFWRTLFFAKLHGCFSHCGHAAFFFYRNTLSR